MAFNSKNGLRLLPRETPMSSPGNRIGLLGGTFDPPHAGHVDASLHALKRLQLDRVWWLVTPGNPLKKTEGLASVAKRLQWCRDLVRDHRIEVTGFEAGLASAYTANTIAHLLTQRPTTHFVWLMGGDGLVSFHRWHKWQSIIASVPIAVVDRPGFRLAALSSRTAQAFSQRRIPEVHAAAVGDALAPAWVYLTVPNNPLSSTELRNP